MGSALKQSHTCKNSIHIMKKSKYSGLYGDYSSFSDEMEEMGNIAKEDEN